MSTGSLDVLIFAQRDDRASGWQRAWNFRSELELRTGIEARMVEKSGFVLEDLHLVARHRVTTTPAVVVVHHASGREVFRRVSLPPVGELIEALNVHAPSA